jgi:hypothetical protein
VTFSIARGLAAELRLRPDQIEAMLSWTAQGYLDGSPAELAESLREDAADRGWRLSRWQAARIVSRYEEAATRGS